jgi:riboflavin kinase/FMN adenylyltransferase
MNSVTATHGEAVSGASSGSLVRPVMVAGWVVDGSGGAREAGFPTVRISSPSPPLLDDGVFAGLARLADGAAYLATISVRTPEAAEGRGGPAVVQAHLLDFEADLRGQWITFELALRLREQREFGSAEELVAQLRVDRAATRWTIELPAARRGG